MRGPWTLDAGLAADLADAVGWDPATGPVELSDRLPRVVPCGSTAKLAAVAAGQVPPGADVAGLARAVVDLDRARRSAPPAAAPSWSCWVLAPLHAALVDWAGIGPAQVVALRRIDEGPDVAPVDFHSAVAVDVDGTSVVCDPYFGLGLVRPTEAGARAEVRTGLGWAEVATRADGRWELAVRLAKWERGFRYQVVAPNLDAGDVHALCAISVHHSGVPARPYARLHEADAVVEIQHSGEGEHVVQRWVPGGPDGAGSERTTLPTWADALDRFAAWTGVRITGGGVPESSVP